MSNVGAVGAVPGSGASAQDQQLENIVVGGMAQNLVFNQLMQIVQQTNEAASADDPDDPNSDG
ncbi:MAG: hypothetical protein J2P47_10480 [Acetobacteraceae bacterium]|nr:hypothetical protein [Acetobacteraceae bacterium]